MNPRIILVALELAVFLLGVLLRKKR